MVSQNTLDNITHLLVKEFAPEQVILFGSQAWGVPTGDSDVDIMVIVGESTEPGHDRAVRAHRALRGVRVPKDVIVETRAEFSFRASAKSSLEHRIRAEGRLLYG